MRLVRSRPGRQSEATQTEYFATSGTVNVTASEHHAVRRDTDRPEFVEVDPATHVPAAAHGHLAMLAQPGAVNVGLQWWQR